MILLVITVYGVGVCDDTPEPNKKCVFVTPPINCSIYDYTIYNNETINETGNLSSYKDDLYQFNFSKAYGEYVIKLCDGTSREVYVGGDELSNLSFIIGVIGIVGAFLYFSFKLGKEHEFLKTALALFSIFLLALIPYFLLDNNETISTTLFYQLYIYFIWIFTAYIFIYFMIKVFNYLAGVWKPK